MTLEQAMEKIKALWPQHDVTQTPLSAKGMLQILEELGLIKFGEEEFTYDAELGKALLSVPHPENNTNPPEDLNPDSLETVELTKEQVKGNAKQPLLIEGKIVEVSTPRGALLPDKKGKVKVAKEAANEG